ncbi:hypothetical protein GYMLUDRAFT_1023288 [Collybiopsis luxurians FD-317 M1]|nr:hypothetical protein GYMLUDRAFT_1023288 [Collybiopsis luxurians FD-317 M1]
MSDAVTIVLDGNTFTAPAGFLGPSHASLFNFTIFEPNSTFNLSFQGISIAFIGGASESGNRNSSAFHIEISQSDFFFEFSPEYPQSITPQTVLQWYTSPSLPDSPDAYNLELSNLQLVGIDYVLIEAGSNTPLTGHTILVDDTNPEIIWTGHWTNQSEFTTSDGLVQRPNGNGTHSSSTSGLIFTNLQISTNIHGAETGTSITVAGVISLSSGDSFTASFTLDNSSPTIITYQLPNVPNPHTFNFIYFNDSSLGADNHTLTVNLTQVAGNAAFVVDYLMYEPAFDFLSGKPNFTQPSVISGSGSSSAGPSPTGSRGDSSHQSHVNIGAIGCSFTYADENDHQEGGMNILRFLPWISNDYLGTEPLFNVNPLIIEPSYKQPSATKTNPTPNVSSGGMTHSEHRAALQHHADELAELERERERQQEILTHSLQASSSSLAQVQASLPTQPGMQDQISDINARIEVLTRLIREHMSPPAYDQDGHS